MAKTDTASNKKEKKQSTKPVAKKTSGSKVKSVPAQKQTAERKTTAARITGASDQKTKIPAKSKSGTKINPKTSSKKTERLSSKPVTRYKCKLCGYIYSPLRGEPHNGIPRGTSFDDLPEDYVCPICGMEGKGKIGKWGFEEWRPTRYICSICGYIYDEKRGEPHRNIKPGTKFENLPDSYVCPVCALDPRISVQFGKVFKQGFEPVE